MLIGIESFLNYGRDGRDLEWIGEKRSISRVLLHVIVIRVVSGHDGGSLSLSLSLLSLWIRLLLLCFAFSAFSFLRSPFLVLVLVISAQTQIEFYFRSPSLSRLLKGLGDDQSGTELELISIRPVCSWNIRKNLGNLFFHRLQVSVLYHPKRIPEHLLKDGI